MNDRPTPLIQRLGGIVAILGGLLWGVLDYLWFLSHGPTGFDENKLVLGLQGEDYRRFEIIPIVLIFLAFIVLHSYQKYHLGKLGKIGYVITLTSYGSLIIVQFLQIVFDFPHPVHNASWFIGVFLLLPLLFIGWLLFGIDTIRAGELPRWSRGIPLFMGFAIVILFLWALFDLASLSGYPPSTVFAILHGLGWILLGYMLLSSRIGYAHQSRSAA